MSPALMKVQRAALVLSSLIAGIALCACAKRQPPPAPQDDGRAQLVRAMDRMKQPSSEAQGAVVQARSVLDAIGGVTQMQSDGSASDH